MSEPAARRQADLKILHADGRYSLYDRVSGDKSGGETQTPYYIRGTRVDVPAVHEPLP